MEIPLRSEQTYDEKDIILRISLGDEAAFSVLVKRYSGLLYTYIFKVTHDEDIAEDVVQEIFTQLWLTRESLIRIDTFRSYLFVMSRNHAIRLLRNIGKEEEALKQWWYLNQKHYEAPVSESSSSELEQFDRLIRGAIDQLPPQQKRAWLLSRRDGRKYAEIAEEMGLSRETVKKYLQLAGQSISEYIRKHGLDLVFAWLITRL